VTITSGLSSRRIAVVGATGVVGREVLAVLADRGVPASSIVALASSRSVGTGIPYRGSTLTVGEATAGSFAGIDVAIFTASSAVARALAPHALEAGATVVDNSSAFRLAKDVPLIVPEINGGLISAGEAKPRIIANPNCSAIILLMAVEPVRRRFGLSSIVVSTYQAVSGAGQAGLDALTEEIALARESGGPGRSQASPFAEPCFLNVFSHNSAVDPVTGLNGEEQKIIDESRKILGWPGLAVTPTCVRVPVMRAHSEAITIRLEKPASYAEVVAAYEGFPGVRVMDDRASNRFPTPLKAAGNDDVLVGRFRPDPSRELDASGRTDAWCLFACGDQLRKGAALNAVQIAERLPLRAR
jgi:aspartate-semialdehyde dehydrogenase